MSCEPPEYDGTNAEVLEPIAINEEVIIHLIKNTAQPPHLNVRMVTKVEDENDASNDESGSDDVVYEVAIECMCVNHSKHQASRD